MISKKIIIVGGNAAGPSAAAKAKRVNPNAEIIIWYSVKNSATHNVTRLKGNIVRGVIYYLLPIIF